MKLHIIQPTYYTDPVSRNLFRSKKLNLVPLTLPHLAALVPEGIDIGKTKWTSSSEFGHREHQTGDTGWDEKTDDRGRATR
jgi:hypothetical protein